MKSKLQEAFDNVIDLPSIEYRVTCDRLHPNSNFNYIKTFVVHDGSLTTVVKARTVGDAIRSAMGVTLGEAMEQTGWDIKEIY